MSDADESAMRPLEVILFDAAGTLFRTAEPVWEVYAAAGREFAWGLDPGRVKVAFRAVWRTMPEPDWSKAGNDAERAWWRKLVRSVLAGAGLEEPGDCFDAYFETLWGHYARASAWELYGEVEEVLQQLRGRYRLGVLSNFDDRLYSVLQGLGILGIFEEVTISSHAKVRKPHPDIFAQALLTHRVRASQVLHVGDEPEADWGGARRAGLRWYELRRPENDLRSLMDSAYLG